jgi:hypothetical protein
VLESRARRGAPAAARRCSRSATSRSCATAARARSSRRSGARRRSSTSRARPSGARARRPAAAPQPGVLTRDDCARCGR